MNKSIFFIPALLLTILACSLAGGSEPSNIPPDLLFRDNFSDTSSGWDQVDDGDIITDYDNGVYHVSVNLENTDVWANPGLIFVDTVIEVEATKVGGPDDNYFGIICRYQGPDNYYFFVISSDGYYAIAKRIGGDLVLISSENMEYSDVVNPGSATNRLKVECIGNNLVLRVNEQVLGEAEDKDYPTGDVGLIVGTFDMPGTEVNFDDFLVRKP